MKIKAVIIEDEPFALKLMESFVGMSENLEIARIFLKSCKGIRVFKKREC